jgi:hypothetical protein
MMQEFKCIRERPIYRITLLRSICSAINQLVPNTMAHCVGRHTGASGFRRWRHAKKAETGIGIFRVVRVDGFPHFIIGHKHCIDNMDDA